MKDNIFQKKKGNHTQMKQLNINKITLKLFMIISITALCTYTVFPFLAIYFTKKGLSLSQVGLLLGTTAFATAFFGISSTFFEKFLGIKKTLFLGIIITGTGYILYTVASNFFALLTIAILQGFGQGITNPLLKKYIAVNNQGTESQAFRYRYIIFCIAGIVGPILGNILSLFTVEFMLKTVGAIYISGIFILKSTETSQEEKKIVPKLVINSNTINFKIIILIILGAIVFLEFSIFENITPLALQLFSDNAEVIFSILLIINSVLAIVLQSFFIFLNENITLRTQIIIGNLSFFVAFLIFAISKGNILLILLATIAFTLGEALLIPLLDIMIVKIVDKDKLSTIYAIAELKQLGFFIGPAMAGILLQKFNATIMYLSIALICIVGMVIFLQLAKKNKP